MSVPGGRPVSLGIVWLCLSWLRRRGPVNCSGSDWGSGALENQRALRQHVARPGSQGRGSTVPQPEPHRFLYPTPFPPPMDMASWSDGTRRSVGASAFGDLSCPLRIWIGARPITASSFRMTMKQVRIQSWRSLRDEMKAVARGERRAPRDASKPSFESVDVVVRLLTPENRKLLALIRDRKPGSVAELVTLTGRAQPNLTRTLAKLEAVGFIQMTVV